MSFVGKSAGITFVFASTALFSPVSSAQSSVPNPYPGGFVIAKSRFNNGTMRGQVRRAALGWRVQLPNGRWVYCRRNCSETLRVETIDFFEFECRGLGAANQ